MGTVEDNLNALIDCVLMSNKAGANTEVYLIGIHDNAREAILLSETASIVADFFKQNEEDVSAYFTKYFEDLFNAETCTLTLHYGFSSRNLNRRRFGTALTSTASTQQPAVKTKEVKP